MSFVFIPTSVTGNADLDALSAEVDALGVQISLKVGPDDLTTFTNKTVQGESNIVSSDKLETNIPDTYVGVKTGPPPTTGQALIATSATEAQWGSLDHTTALLNVGTLTHDQLDAHTVALTNPHQVSLQQAYNVSKDVAIANPISLSNINSDKVLTFIDSTNFPIVVEKGSIDSQGNIISNTLTATTQVITNNVIGDGVGTLTIDSGVQQTSINSSQINLQGGQTTIALDGSITTGNAVTNSLGNVSCNSLSVDNGNLTIDTVGGVIRQTSDKNMMIDVGGAANRMLCLQKNSVDCLCVSADGVKLAGTGAVAVAGQMNLTTLADGSNAQSLLIGTNLPGGGPSNVAGPIEFYPGSNIIELSINPNPTSKSGNGSVDVVHDLTVGGLLNSANIVKTVSGILADVSGNVDLSAVYAAASHTHAISDVTNLQNSLNSKLNTDGGTMSGPINMGNNGFFNVGEFNGYVPMNVNGDTMSGNLNMAGNQIIDVGLLNGQTPVLSVNGVNADVAGNVAVAAGGALAYIYLTKATLQSINPNVVTTITGYSVFANLVPAGQPAAFTSNGTTVSILVTGVYSIVAEGGWAPAAGVAGNQRETWIAINGNTGGNRYGWNRTPPGVEFVNYVCTTVVPLNAGDNVSLLVGHDASVAVNFGVNALPPGILEWTITRIL